MLGRQLRSRFALRRAKPFLQLTVTLKLHHLVSLALCGGFAAKLLLAKPSECVANIRALTESDLKGGDPERLLLVVLHSHSNPLHCEFMENLETKQTLNRIAAKFPRLQIVMHELSQEVIELDCQRLKSKNRPTVLLRANDSLSRVDPNDVLDLNSFERKMQWASEHFTVKSVAEFAGFLAKGGLDNQVVIYFDRDQTSLQTACKYLVHSTQHPILRVEDD
jgi:hypothetical protein